MDWCISDFQGGSTVQMSSVGGLIPLSLVRGPISLYSLCLSLMLHCVDKTANTEQFVCFTLVPVSVAMPLLVINLQTLCAHKQICICALILIRSHKLVRVF